MALEGDEMGDANELTEQLRALFVEHGPAALLRAVSVGARELAEESPHREDALIAVAATTAQVAEAISDGSPCRRRRRRSARRLRSGRRGLLRRRRRRPARLTNRRQARTRERP